MKKNLLVKTSIVLLLTVLFLSGNVYAQQIVFVYEPNVIDETTGESPEAPMMALFEEQGYEVVPFTTFTISNATEEELNQLDEADLIYIGRAVPSTNFQSPNKEIWHTISAPIMTGNMWGLRSNRINWFESEACANIDEAEAVVSGDILTEDPVFEGLEGTVEWWYGNYSTINIDNAGNGEVLATTSDNGYVLFARWEEGVEFYDGAGEEPAGERVFIGCGNDNMTNDSGQKVWNYLGFSDDIKQVFLNEVARLLGVFDPVGVDNKAGLQASVYPVPANNRLTIKMENLSNVKVMDLSGRSLSTFDADDNKITVDVSNLNTGLYLLQISDVNGNSITKRISKN